MLLTDIDHLSVWEVAHRWHDVDANLTDPIALPLAVQDTLRTITRLQYRHELPVCSTSGVVRKNERTLVSFEKYVVPEFMQSEVTETEDEAKTHGDERTIHKTRSLSEDPSCDLTEDERRESYEAFSANWLSRHNAAVESFPRCFDHREFDKATLSSVHINQDSVREMCELLAQPLPTFWFSPNEVKEHRKRLEGEHFPGDEDNLGGRINQTRIDAFWARLASKQQHRLLCRAIATELWRLNPNKSIAEICRDHAIQGFGGGRYYTKADTLREWIKDLDPRPDEQKKGGRPVNN
jgi:hypothetical protein